MCFDCLNDYERMKVYARQRELKWSAKAEAALTGFMLGLPTGDYKFEIIAGAPAPEPKIRPDDETTRMMRDRIKARKARNAERVRRHRQRKRALQSLQNVKVTALHSVF